MLSGLNFVGAIPVDSSKSIGAHRQLQLAHGSQDLYTTFMQLSKGFTPSLSTKANIIGETGAVAGALFGGFASQIIGRRVTLMAACTSVMNGDI
jgi:hypothetical protein